MGITASEIKRITTDTVEALHQSNLSDKINDVVSRAKNFPPQKSVEMVLSVCEDILCQSHGDLSPDDKDLFLRVFAQYTMQKRILTPTEKKPKPKDYDAR